MLDNPKAVLNDRQPWPAPRWDGWRDAWVIAGDAYSTRREKADDLVATVNAYVEAGSPSVALDDETARPEFDDYFETWEIADDVWAWNEQTAMIAARAIAWRRTGSSGRV